MKFIKKNSYKLVAICMAAAVTATGLGFSNHVSAAPDSSSNTFAEQFANPSFENKPKIRWWFPSGAVDIQQVKHEIDEFVKQGFGGAEILCKEVVDEAGWNSQAYIDVIAQALQYIDENYPGFQLDITQPLGSGTSCINSITSDQNELVAQQLSYDKVIVSAGETAQLTLNTKENTKLLSVNAYPVDEETEYISHPGMVGNSPAPTYVYQDGSYCLTDTEGVVDRQNNTITWSTPADTKGKWVLVACYQSPTDQTNGKYPSINPISTAAVNELLRYYEETVVPSWLPYADHINAMFIDSYEYKFGDGISAALGGGNFGVLWSDDFLEEFQNRRGYDVTPYLAYLPSPTGLSNFVDLIGGAYGEDGAFQTADGMSVKIRNDYYQTLTELFVERYLNPIQQWCEQHGWNARVQNYGLSVDMTAANLATGIPETESMYYTDQPDGYRLFSGTVHMGDKKILSTEVGVEGNGNYAQKLTDLTDQINISFASGINQMVLHGSCYSGEYHGVGNQNGYVPGISWPGYEGFGLTSYANAWGERQVQWGMMGDSMKYVARNQYVMRQGEAKVDLAFFRNTYFESQMYQPLFVSNLEQYGYSYDFISPALMDLDSAKVSTQNGQPVLDADGPAYKALIVNHENHKGNQQHPDEMQNLVPLDLSLDAANQLLEYAKAGLPIVFVGELPSTAKFFTESDEDITKIVEQIISFENVYQVTTERDLPALLQQIDITPDTSYAQPSSLLSQHRQDTNADYYYFYNQGDKQTVTTITLDSEGIPYLLDAWTGEITPIAQYQIKDGTTTFSLSFDAKETALLAIAQDGWNETTPSSHAVASDTELRYNSQNQLVARISEPGNYQITLQDGTTKQISVNDELTPITLDNWTLSIESWTKPDDPTLLTTIKKTKLEPIQLDKLVPWREIQGLEDVSGIGTYTTTFQLDNWNQQKGATIQLGDISDVYQITVNGHTLQAANQIDTNVDIGAYLQQGENTISIKVSSTFINYINSITPQTRSGKVNSRENQDYGMMGVDGVVSLLPYEDVMVSETADKSILNKVIDYADNAANSDEFDNVIADVQTSFTEALNNAKAVASDSNANQIAVDEAWQTLLNEIHKLGFVKGDIHSLEQLVALAESYDLNNYIEAGQAKFKEALAAAQRLIADKDNAMQAEIEAAETNLLNAMLDLRFKADKSILEAVIVEANEKDATSYTTESYAALTAAVKEAQDVLVDDNATQDEVNTAVAKVQSAMDGLVTVDGKINEAQTTNNNVTQTSQTSTTTKANAAKTGDFTPIVGAAMLAIAGTVILIVRKRK